MNGPLLACKWDARQKLTDDEGVNEAAPLICDSKGVDHLAASAYLGSRSW